MSNSKSNDYDNLEFIREGLLVHEYTHKIQKPFQFSEEESTHVDNEEKKESDLILRSLTSHEDAHKLYKPFKLDDDDFITDDEKERKLALALCESNGTMLPQMHEKYQKDPEFIGLAIESFKRYECSKDYDLEVLRENPTELIQVLSSYDFTKEQLNPDYIPEVKPFRIEFGD